MLQRVMLRPASAILAVLVALATLATALFDMSSTVRAGAAPEIAPVVAEMAAKMTVDDHILVLHAQTLVVIHEDSGGESHVTIMDPERSLVVHLSGVLTLTEGVGLGE